MVNPATHGLAPSELFAVDFATLAREIAQDIFTVDQIVAEQVVRRRVAEDPAAPEVRRHPCRHGLARVELRRQHQGTNRIKAATGLELQLEVFIADINDAKIALNQRVEAGKFLARLGELDGAKGEQSTGGGVTINIVTGQHREPVRIEAKATPPSATLPLALITPEP